jgi:predicted transcriptional regulator YheO
MLTFMNGYSGFPDESLDAVFEMLGRLATAFVLTLGEHTEIVVHDLRTIDASVIAIAGNLTNRVVGAPIPDPEFMPDRLRSMREDEFLYTTQTPDGRRLCSSTVWIRNLSGVIRGAVCVNVDYSQLEQANELLGSLMSGLPSVDSLASLEATPPLTTFARSIEDFVDTALGQVQHGVGKPIHQWTKAERITAIASLEEQGVFQLRRSVETVAQHLGVSRATLFSDLREIRHHMPDEDEAEG